MPFIVSISIYNENINFTLYHNTACSIIHLEARDESFYRVYNIRDESF